MRLVSILLLAACAVPTLFAEEAAAGDAKAQQKEIYGKMAAMKAQVMKDDPEVAKLKAAADEARKAVDAAAEAKLADNADYQALKAKLDELRGKKEPKEPKEKKHEKKEGGEKPAE